VWRQVGEGVSGFTSLPKSQLTQLCLLLLRKV
jgi:hypothetical protein